MDKHFETERVSNKRKIMYYNFIAELAKTEMFFDFIWLYFNQNPRDIILSLELK